MRSRPKTIATAAVMLGVIALPVVAATPATATPASGLSAPYAQKCDDRPGPWVIKAKAVKIRSKPSAKSTSTGVLYRGHKFAVHKSRSGWHYITDKTTSTKGWVSGAYVYRDHEVCLH